MALRSSASFKILRPMFSWPYNYASRNLHDVLSGAKKSRKTRWFWIPIPLGLGLIGLIQLRHVISREQRKQQGAADTIAKQWQVNLYRRMPLRSMSRVWGQVNSVELPVWSRRPLLGLYIWAFGCKLEEAAIEDLTHYKNLGEFFRRPLKPGVRPIDKEHNLVMPSDGRVLNFGKVKEGVIEQVKGVTYSLKGFFGPSSWKLYEKISERSEVNPATDHIEHLLREAEKELHGISDEKYFREILRNSDNELYHIVLYLAPGDYHRFHSPVDWIVKSRRHFPGELLSVNPNIARWVQGLFNMNERAIYFGEWEHGFFSMTAVGATNVGSIKTYFDKGLETNSRRNSGKEMVYHDRVFPGGVPMRRGESFGEFNLGSTIVLVFEAPKDFDFSNIHLNAKVCVGQPLGKVESDSECDSECDSESGSEEISSAEL